MAAVMRATRYPPPRADEPEDSDEGDVAGEAGVGPTGQAAAQRDEAGQQRRESAWKVPEDDWYESRMGPGAIGGQNLAAFIRKVYGILTFQMIITVAMCMIAMFVPAAQRAFIGMLTSSGLRFLLFIPTMCTLCALHAKKAVHPTNYYLLILFTVLMSCNLAGICALYAKAGMGILILEAFSITMGAFGGLTLYALRSGQDFTWMGGMLTMSLFGLIFCGLIGALFGFSGGIVVPIVGTIVFCGFILYDTSRILRVYGPDDAIIAAIELYLDIVNLFLYILEILSRSDNS